MTAKEKAKELFDKYYNTIYFVNNLLENKIYINDTFACRISKQCAIIAIDELLNDVDASSPFEIERLTFWKEVKQEIEKL